MLVGLLSLLLLLSLSWFRDAVVVALDAKDDDNDGRCHLLATRRLKFGTASRDNNTQKQSTVGSNIHITALQKKIKGRLQGLIYAVLCYREAYNNKHHVESTKI